MTQEIEAKIQTDNHQRVRARLEELGGQRLGEVLEVNRYFDTEGEGFLRADSGLRLRCTGKKCELCYKGPLQDSLYKQREEIQTTVGDAEALELVLLRLGLKRVLLYEKRRESWQLEDCRVELDTVPLLGTFVEVEGPSERAIGAVLAKLALVEAEPLKKTYPGLLREHLAQTNNVSREIRF